MENSPSNIERHTGEPHSGLQDEVMSIEKKLKYTVVGIGVLTGLFFLGRRLIRKEKKANADSKSFETGSPEAISSQIRLALENKNRIGINLTQLRQILIGIPSKSQMQAIRTAYFNQYQKLMNDDIKSKISQEVHRNIKSRNSLRKSNFLKFAASGTNRDWKMRQELRSPKYTTRWEDLLELK